MVFMYLVQKLPSEYDLADEFQCSRLTIRKAIELLISQNILVKEKGKRHICHGSNQKDPKWLWWSAKVLLKTARIQGKQTKQVLGYEIAEELPLK